jgi:hypothetical protein
LFFYPKLCRNESEVETKLIVQYLLPKLGYSSDFWFQEVAFGSIRLDFLVFAVQKELLRAERNFPCSLVIEAKHPNQNLDNHVGRLKRYLTSLNVQYGLLTNSKDLRIFKNLNGNTNLIFRCSGQDIESKIEEIKLIIGRNNLVLKFSELQDQNKTNLQINHNLQTKKHFMKVIAVYHNKGGVGKTTTVVNLAAALSKKGKRVLVIDLDSQANTTFATGLIKFDDEELDDIKDNNILQVLQSEDYFSIEEVARKSQFSDPRLMLYLLI